MFSQFLCMAGSILDGDDVPSLQAPEEAPAQQEEDDASMVLQAEALPKCPVRIATQAMPAAA